MNSLEKVDSATEMHAMALSYSTTNTGRILGGDPY